MAENNAKIDYIGIVDGLQAQFNTLLQNIKNDPTSFGDEVKTIKAIYVADEQHFIFTSEKDPNAIYIVVKFGSATVNYASSVLPVSFQIMGSENKIRPTQLLLGEFVTAYNLQPLGTTMTQVWYTPTVSSNFNPVNKAFRSLFAMTGILVVGQNTVDVDSVIYVTDIFNSETNKYEEEEVQLMSFDEGYQSSTNPQPFGNTYGFAKTEINFGTNAITFSTYLLDTQLVADCMHARGLTLETGVTGDDIKTSTKGMNDWFKFKIKYTNKYGNNIEYFQKYKLVNYRIGKKIGDIPSFTASFSY